MLSLQIGGMESNLTGQTGIKSLQTLGCIVRIRHSRLRSSPLRTHRHITHFKLVVGLENYDEGAKFSEAG